MEKNLVIKKEKNNDITLEELKQSNDQYDKLILNEYLEFVHPNNTKELLSLLKSKLTKNGRIVIFGHDLYELSYLIINDNISCYDYNMLIADRKQILSSIDTASILQEIRYFIFSKDIDGIKYLIEAGNES